MTDEAIDTLPKGLRPFYKAHRLEMPTLALEADAARGRARSGASPIDRLMPFPFADLPRTEAALKERFPRRRRRSAACPG